MALLYAAVTSPFAALARIQSTTPDNQPQPLLPLHRKKVTTTTEPQIIPLRPIARKRLVKRNRFQPFPFLRLPPELRLMIYDLCIRHKKAEITMHGYPKLTLLHISPSIREEAFPCIGKFGVKFHQDDTEAKIDSFLHVWDKYRPGRRQDVTFRVQCELQEDLATYAILTTKWNFLARREGCHVAFDFDPAKRRRSVRMWLRAGRSRVGMGMRASRANFRGLSKARQVALFVNLVLFVLGLLTILFFGILKIRQYS